MNQKKVCIKNCMCCYFDFDFSNILLDEKLYENSLIYEVFYKTLICAKPLRTMFHKVKFLLEIIMELNIQHF